MFSNNDNIHIEKIYAHLFTPNETASIVSVVYELQGELELVAMNLENNNLSLTQNHASKASSLLNQRILAEIVEDNPKLAVDLNNNLIHLRTISFTSPNQVQTTSQVVSDLNDRLNENALARIAQLQPGSSNLLDDFTKTLGNMFGGNDKEVKEQNAKIEALALANVVDNILIDYGNAYQVGFDMTNMSNMVMPDMNSNVVSMMRNQSSDGNISQTGNMNMALNKHSLNTSSSPMKHGIEMNAGYSLINMSDYQSAQALAVKAFKIFNDKLKLTEMNNKNTTRYITNLENCLIQLNNLVAKKDSPMNVTMIVHTQHHPNLLEAFGLQLRN